MWLAASQQLFLNMSHEYDCKIKSYRHFCSHRFASACRQCMSLTMDFLKELLQIGKPVTETYSLCQLLCTCSCGYEQANDGVQSRGGGGKGGSRKRDPLTERGLVKEEQHKLSDVIGNLLSIKFTVSVKRQPNHLNFN